MKKILFILMLLFAATAMNAQTIVKGDMNDDNELTITDAVSVVDVILGKAPKQTISLVGDPYKVDNTLVVDTWYAPDGTSFTLNEDGTTDFTGATTYKFRYYLGTLTMYNASGKAIKVLGVIEVDKSYLLLLDYVTGACTYYTNSASQISGLTMSESTLTLNSGSTAQLSVTVTPPDALNPSVTWSSSNESVATVDQNGLVTAVAGGTCTITATAVDGSGKSATCQVTVVQLVTSITLSQTLLKLKVDDNQMLTATVLPSNAFNPKVTWSSSNDAVAEVTSAGGVVAAIGRGRCTITCTATDGSGVSATCEVIVYRDESGTINGRDYVDLDLPSRTLWATCNVGASSPEDYGDYFAWGETSTKSEYNWYTYEWSNGDFNKLIKYCTNSSYGNDGFTDNKTELDLDDDAAYANWESAWRMPSPDQYKELINSNYTTTEWTIQNGVNGRLITSKSNGNSVFLPAAGYRTNGLLSGDGSYGYYWSRTLDEIKPFFAWYLGFSSSYISTGSQSDHCSGFSVRPVRISE